MKFIAAWVLLFGCWQGVQAMEIEKKNENLATFAGGCFWCMQSEFDSEKGVLKTVVGFTGGHAENPSYKQVVAGDTGHVEAIEVHYDPAQVSYERLLEIYWSNVDPTDDEGQFCDRGDSYRPVIFAHNETQQKAAEASIEGIRAKGIVVRVPIEKAAPFYAAEDYHQGYYQKSRVSYQAYRYGCGRDKRLKEVWEKNKK